MTEGQRRAIRVRAAALAASLAILLFLGRPWAPNPLAQSSQDSNPLPSDLDVSKLNTAGRQTPAQVKADSKKAKEAYEEGVRDEKAEDWEAAYTAYSDAVNYAPHNRDYFIHRELAKSRVVQERADAAERDAISGKLDKARQELLSATYLDPTNSVLRQRLAELSAAEPGEVRT